MTDSERVDLVLRNASKCKNRDVLLEETLVAIAENLSGHYDYIQIADNKSSHLSHFVRHKKSNVWSDDSPTLVDMGTTCWHSWVPVSLGGIWLGDITICDESRILFWRKAGMV